jgi:hypothetical protein
MQHRAVGVIKEGPIKPLHKEGGSGNVAQWIKRSAKCLSEAVLRAELAT